MSSTLLGSCWFGGVIAVAVVARPRLPPRDFVTARPTRSHGPVLLQWLGQRVLKITRLQTNASEAEVGRVVSVAFVLLFFSPIFSLVYILVSIARIRRRSRALVITRVTAVRSDLSLLIDLLRVALSAGLTLPQAVLKVCDSGMSAATGAEGSGELARRLTEAVHGVRRGERFVDGLARIGEDPVIGSEVRLFIATMVSSEQFGTPLGPSLGQLAEDVRDVRRRRAETEARRVPVRMLAPLVLLLLPSFALLTVAPLLAGGLASLRLN